MLELGIGLGIALAFLEKGAHVVLVSRSLEKMQAAVPDKYKGAKSTASGNAGKAHFVAQDLTTVNTSLSANQELTVHCES